MKTLAIISQEIDPYLVHKFKYFELIPQKFVFDKSKKPFIGNLNENLNQMFVYRIFTDGFPTSE